MSKLITAESLAIVLLVLVAGFLVVLFTTDSFRSKPVGQRDSGFQLFARRPRRRWPVLLGLLAVALSGYLGWRQWPSFETASAPAPAATVTEPTVVAPPITPGAAPAVAEAPLPAPTPAAAPAVDPAVEVSAAIEAWRAAWAARDVQRYLAAYAPDFRPADGQPLADWQIQRRDRLLQARSIRVRIEQLSIEAEAERASARFLQHYRAGSLNDRVRKRLALVRTTEGWKISEEAVEGPGKT